MPGNQLLERGDRPLNKNRDLVDTLVNCLLEAANDERFTSGKVKLPTVLRKLFEEQGVPFENECMEAVFPNATEVELSVLGMRDVCNLGKSSGPLQHFRETILPMIIVGEWDFGLNSDEVKAILKVLELKIDADGKIIDLKTNKPLKNRKEKQKEYDDNPENKAKAKERKDDPENKAKRKERQQKPENKAKQKEYAQKPEYKAKRKERVQKPEYKAKRKERDRKPENRAKAKERRDNPENKAKRKERDQKPENRAKAKAYRDDPKNKLKAKEYRDDPKNKLKAKECRENRKRLFIKKQREIPPPYGSNGGCCTMCARERSIGWMSVVEFCIQIEEDFDNKGLVERQRAEETCRFLNGIKKKAAKDGEYSKIRSKDVLCLRCLRKYKRSATKKIEKILKVEKE
jgi:hypothetical protein